MRTILSLAPALACVGGMVVCARMMRGPKSEPDHAPEDASGDATDAAGVGSEARDG